MEIVDRPWQSNVKRYPHILDALMATAYDGKAVRFGSKSFDLPWSIGGLRNILARRGFRMRTHQNYANGAGNVLDVWCEIIRPPEKTKRFTGARRIRLVERKTI